jgi:poly(3-hydroxybutyrate) depolymerase
MPEMPRNPYLFGATAFIACQRDPRFPYCLHVPASLDWSGSRPARLLVVVHGSRRMAQQEGAAFASFAEEHGVVVLAPLFPMMSATPSETEGYKLLRAYGVEYDEVLLAMVDEASRRYPIDAARFLIHGFSGGGQFAHRFLYLHPRRVLAASIGAPGSVTLLDSSRPWPVGTAQLPTGRGPDIAALRDVAVHLLAGRLDTDTDEVGIRPGSEHWAEGINDCGVTRLDKMAALARSLRASGIDVTETLVDGVAHEGFRLVPAAARWFEGVVARSRAHA